LNEWADTNNIIVLYPQAVPSYGNDYGCWDWWVTTAPLTLRSSARKSRQSGR
jgi:poly(3-hydroxybutyrate) depolymerase